MNEENQNQRDQQNKSLDETTYTLWRRSLRIVLVLSIIGSSMYMLSMLIWGVATPSLQKMVDSGAMVLPDTMKVAFEEMIQTPRTFFMSSALLYAVSLGGVLLMWNLRRIGFHLYTLSQLLVLVVTVLFLGKEHLLLGDVMFTLLFVIYYYFSLRRLGVFVKDGGFVPQKNSDREDL